MLLKRSITIAPLGLLSLITLSGAFLISSYSYATDDNTIDNVSVNVPVSCTMSGTGMNSHNASILNGTYRADIGTTTLKAFCNDPSGFAIYAIGFSNEEYGNTNLIGTGANQTISTGTATSGNTSNWAMKLATDSTATYPLTIDNGFGSYSAVPASYTKVAHRDSGTDTGSSATGASLTSTYAAYISKTQSADTYNGKVKYTLVHPANETPTQPVACEGGKICYQPNSSSVIGQMGKQSASNNTSRALWASNFKRDGYGFAGWNDKFDYSGNFYGPNQTITAPADVQTNGLSLYAVWIKSAGSLQNWNGCSSLTKADQVTNVFSQSITALTDERDGNTYAVAKLADGKCWMIENLRLADKDSSNNYINLSNSNTHNPSLPLTNFYDSNITSNHLSPPSSVNYDAITAPEGWCTTSDTSCLDQSRLRTDNTTLFVDNVSSNYSAASNVYSYGNYYNWYSATAGHGTYDKTNGNTTGDICPAGWHLPTGGSANAEFGSLDVALGGTGAVQDGSAGSAQSAILRLFPNNFVLSGYKKIETYISARNTDSVFWSSSAGNNYSAYGMHFGLNYVDPGVYIYDRYAKFFGKTVRCIAGV